MDCQDVTVPTTKLFNGGETFRFITGIASSLIFSAVLSDTGIVARVCAESIVTRIQNLDMGTVASKICAMRCLLCVGTMLSRGQIVAL